MTYYSLFAIVFGCGIATLIAVTVFLIKEKQRALPLAIVAAAWLYAANLLMNISTRFAMARYAFDSANWSAIVAVISIVLMIVLGVVVTLKARIAMRQQ